MATGKDNFLGSNLRELRLARGLSHDDVASALGIAAPTYSSWERGRTEPSVAALLSLARYYGVSIDRLLMSRPRMLRIGSCLQPLGKFHPIKNENGIYSMIYGLIFNRLYSFDVYEKRIDIDLVEAWRVDRDSRNPAYTFYLRSNVTFHYGDFLGPEDVKSSYDLFLELHPFFKQFVDSVEVRKQEYAVELRLFKWLDLEFLPNPYIIPRSHVDDEECFDGTGPFKLIEEEQQSRLREGMEQPVRLEASSSYYGKMPSIEAMEFSTYRDLGELRDSLEGGRIDMAYDLEMDESERFHVEYCHGYLSFYLVLDQDADICKDENVRKAVDFAIDRERIVEKIGAKRAKLMPNSHLYLILREKVSSEPMNNYNLEEAKACWGKAKDSLARDGIEDTKIKIGSSFRGRVQIADMLISDIIEQLKEAGIDVEEEVDYTKAHARIQPIAFRVPEAVYNNLHSFRMSKRSWKYSNSYVDHLLDNIEGIDTYLRIQDILNAERLFLPLFRRTIAVSHAKNLDTKSKIKSGILHSANVIHWEFR